MTGCVIRNMNRSFQIKIFQIFAFRNGMWKARAFLCIDIAWNSCTRFLFPPWSTSIARTSKESCSEPTMTYMAMLLNQRMTRKKVWNQCQLDNSVESVGCGGRPSGGQPIRTSRRTHSQGTWRLSRKYGERYEGRADRSLECAVGTSADAHHTPA